MLFRGSARSRQASALFVGHVRKFLQVFVACVSFVESAMKRISRAVVATAVRAPSASTATVWAHSAYIGSDPTCFRSSFRMPKRNQEEGT